MSKLAKSKTVLKQELIAAIHNNEIDSVEQLLEQGANVNSNGAAFKKSRTGLSIACYNGNIPMIELLLTKGAEINKALYNETPLSSAIENEQIEAVNRLLLHNADVNIKLTNGETAIERAIEKKNIDIVRSLMAYGAQITRLPGVGLLQQRANHIFLEENGIKVGDKPSPTSPRYKTSSKRGGSAMHKSVMHRSAKHKSKTYKNKNNTKRRR